MTMMIHSGICIAHPHVVLMNIFFAMNFQLFKQSTYIPEMSMCIDKNIAVQHYNWELWWDEVQNSYSKAENLYF